MNKEAICNAIAEMFPEVETIGYIKRPQVIMIKDKYNLSWSQLAFITDAKVARGCYSVSADNKKTSPMISNQKTVPVAIVESTQPNQVQNVIPIAQYHTHASVSSDVNVSLIPQVDPNFIPFGCYSQIDAIVKTSIFAPVYITGHSGTGKNVMVEQICAKNKRQLIRINMHNQITEDDLIGTKTLVNGNIEIVEGPLLIAMRTGAICVLDELDSCTSNFFLHSILEGKPYYFRLKNEMIHPKPGFNIIGLGNTLGKGDDTGRYIGTNILNEAFLDRFALTFKQDYPSKSIEKRIVVRLMKSLDCHNDAFAEKLTGWSDVIRRTFDAGGIDELITTRRLVHIVKGYAIFRNEAIAIELGCNRFDELSRKAFVDLYEKISGSTTETITETEAPTTGYADLEI